MPRSGFIKSGLLGWVEYEAQAQGKRAGVNKGLDVVMGLVDHRLPRWVEEGRDFIYLDHAYFNRGWSNNMFRAVRKGVHLTELLDRPDDRMRRFGVKVEPWRRNGRKVVVIPPSPYQCRIGAQNWLTATLAGLRKATDRLVVVKWEKGGLRECLLDAWAVVTWASVAGVESALMGVPVFASPRCPAYPVSAGPISKIETPEYSERRHEWASSLAYASWHADEIESVPWLDYQYALCNNVAPVGL